MTVGVPNENGLLAFLWRGVSHTVVPVLPSSATTDCLSRLSQLNTRRPSTSTGDPPLPWTGFSYRSVRVHKTLPCRSSAAVPMWPKWTYSRSPSVVGVGLAWLFLLCILDACSFD